MDKIAVIVPVYNVEKYLPRCIDSILKQTYYALEIVLVDDGSSDSSGKICDDYALTDNRIHLIHQDNQGLSAARNAGIDWTIQHNVAQYITFIDSDDWVEPDYVKELWQGIQYTGCVACITLKRCYETGYVEYATTRRRWHVLTPEEYLSTPISHNIVACAKLYRLSLFDGIRFPPGRQNEDVFTVYKLLCKCSTISFRRLPLYNYLARTGSIRQSQWSPQKLDLVMALEEQCNYFLQNGFLTAHKFARGRLMVAMMEMLPQLSHHDPERAEEFRQRIDAEQGKAPLSFWSNRDFYRLCGTRYYKLKWCIALLIDFLTSPRKSWLANECIPNIRNYISARNIANQKEP